jgi:hypothetical protein
MRRRVKSISIRRTFFGAGIAGEFHLNTLLPVQESFCMAPFQRRHVVLLQENIEGFE